MSGLRAFSSPELLAPEKNKAERSEDYSFEGVSTNVKLLLKLIQDHNEASSKDAVDERKAQRVAGMISIIEDVKGRIQKSQTTSRVKPELRRCNTDLRSNAPRDKKPSDVPMVIDEKEKLRRQLSASLAARKSLEMMCTSLGKEKEIMAAELTRKVQELGGLEELVSDLKAQNDMLLSKVKTCAAEHREKKETGQPGNSVLQERNKALSEQLLKSLDGYRSLKRKLKDSQEESVKISLTLDEIGSEVQKGFARIQSLKEKTSSVSDVKEEIMALEGMFDCLALKVSKHKQKKNECPKTKSESKASKVSAIA